MRLATLLDALLLRYLCVPLPALPPPPMRYKLLQENVTALRTAALPRARKSSSSSLLSSPPEPLYLSIAQDESAQLRRAVRMLRPLFIHFSRHPAPHIRALRLPRRFLHIPLSSPRPFRALAPHPAFC
jgi:hypothetical protein